jgi:hypothetical protein
VKRSTRDLGGGALAGHIYAFRMLIQLKNFPTMIRKATVSLFVLLLTIACKKEPQDGLNSLIDIQSFSSNSSCPSGGLTIKTGLDVNRNNILDPPEVTNTKFLCNGQNGSADKQIFLPINFSANSTSTTPVIGGELIKFSKKNYPNVDSIVLVANPYVDDIANTAIVELYNITDNVAVRNGMITTNRLWAGFTMPFLQSGNVYSSLPDKEITLGISFRSGTQGKFAAAGSCYLLLFRK